MRDVDASEGWDTDGRGGEGEGRGVAPGLHSLVIDLSEGVRGSARGVHVPRLVALQLPIQLLKSVQLLIHHTLLTTIHGLDYISDLSSTFGHIFVNRPRGDLNRKRGGRGGGCELGRRSDVGLSAGACALGLLLGFALLRESRRRPEEGQDSECNGPHSGLRMK